jgi:hypothetical protein
MVKFRPQCGEEHAMKPTTRGFLIASAALLALSLGPGLLSAQSQDDTSVADAARRAREQKKNAAKPARTVTNDDLPAALPAEGNAVTAPSEQATGEDGKPAPGAADKKAAAADQEKLAAKKADAEAALKQAKADLAQCEGELNVLERKQKLDSDSYYSKTGYGDDAQGKALLDADAREIGDKKSQTEALKTKISALQAEIAEYPDPEKGAAAQPN